MMKSLSCFTGSRIYPIVRDATSRLLLSNKYLCGEQSWPASRKGLDHSRKARLHPDFTVGTQLSSSARRLLGRDVKPGDNLLDTLIPMLNPKDHNDAREYMELLFSPHVKDSLVQSINPLAAIELLVPDAMGQIERRFLSMSFNRVVRENSVHYLLVTMQDITQRVALEHSLTDERQRARKEFASLMQAMKTDATVLHGFVERGEAQLLQINELLRSVSDTASETRVRKVIDEVFRIIHTFKGEATSLDLEMLATMAHDLENDLAALRRLDRVSGEMLLGLPLSLESLLEKLHFFRSFHANRDEQVAEGERQDMPAMHRRLVKVVEKVSQDLGKKVAVNIVLDWPAEAAPQAVRNAEDIAIQLLRNAVAHGIEAPLDRVRAGKPEAGHVQVLLKCNDEGEVELRVADNGRGLDIDAMRQRLAQMGWYDQTHIDGMTDRQVVGQIFKAGFSTADNAGEHAGRGVGLDVVLAQIRGIGGHLRLNTHPGTGTEFILVIPQKNVVNA